MLTITDLTYRIGGRTLLDGASAQINAGWKVGLVGRNGAGKSTLLDLIRDVLHPDAGSLKLQRGLRLGFVAQEAPAGEQSPLDVVLAADEERASLFAEAETATDPQRIAEIQMRLVDIDAHSATARAARILSGLGFDHNDQQRPMQSFSGGWRMRVALAAALFAEPDLLLLDEPTNHLDLEATLWLESFLGSYRRTLLLVSHDREFLNNVSTHILALAERKLSIYSGGYDAYLRAKREALARNQALAAKQANQRAHLQSFIDRFRAKATKASQAQSRMKALAKLEPVSLASEEASIPFSFPDPEEMNPPLIALDLAEVGYEPGKPILKRLNLRIDPDDRIALLGANGNGKSTLAKFLSGRLPAQGGKQTRSSKLRCGFFAQHQIEELESGRTAYDHLAALMKSAPPEKVRAGLARFGFGQDKAFVKVDDLSGGEKARLTLALVTYDAPHILILDEPTNHLDIEAREALVQAINDYAGAVILISHDWHLLSLTADRLWLVAGGTAEPFQGDLSDYRRLLLERPSAAENSAKQSGEGGGKQARQASADRRRQIDPLRRKVKAAEEQLATLNARKAEIDRQLADPTTYAKVGSDVQEMLRKQGELQGKIDIAEAAWLEASEALEQAE